MEADERLDAAAARIPSVKGDGDYMERGEDVARNLDKLYAYLQRRLTDGHIRNDDEALGEVAEHLSALGSAWREAANRGPAR